MADILIPANIPLDAPTAGESLGNPVGPLYLGGWSTYIEFVNWFLSTKTFTVEFQLSTYSTTLTFNVDDAVNAANAGGTYTQLPNTPVTDANIPLVNARFPSALTFESDDGSVVFGMEIATWRSPILNTDDGLWYIVIGSFFANNAESMPDPTAAWSVSLNPSDPVIGAVLWGDGSTNLTGVGASGNIKITATASWAP